MATLCSPRPRPSLAKALPVSACWIGRGAMASRRPMKPVSVSVVRTEDALLDEDAVFIRQHFGLTDVERSRQCW